MDFSHLSRVAPSATVAINSLALQKKTAGERVYNLSAGEPIMPTPTVVLEAANLAMREGKTLYPPVAGIPELRRAAAEWMGRVYGAPYNDFETIVTCGGKFGLYAVFQALLNPMDVVLVVSPYWVSYPSMVALFGGVPKIVQTTEEQDWKIEVKDLEKAATPKTKILVLNNAANPTGVLYSRAELEDILAWAKQRDVMVVSDEVYSGLVYDGQEFVSCGSFLEYRENVIVIQSCSKHFAMTGWRVGFVFAPKKIIDVLSVIQSQSTTGTASVSQWAALAAVQNADVIIPNVRAEMQKRRDALVSALSKNFQNISVPVSGLYVFLSLKTLGINTDDSVGFCERLLREANIALVPGEAFGQDGYVRFSFGGIIEEIEAGVTVMQKYISAS